LNVVALAVIAALIRTDTPLSTELGFAGFTIIAGVLVGLFGLVFNVGAAAAHGHLVQTEKNLKLYINSEFKENVRNRPGYEDVMKSPDGRTTRLTRLFFVLCSSIWVLLGIALCFLEIDFFS
jgi:hypothetical protein